MKPMKKFLLLFAAILLAVLPTTTRAATNTIATGTAALVLPTVVPSYAASGITETNRTGAALGAFVRDGSIVRQLTSNGWEVCPTARRFVIFQVIGGAGTAIIQDGRGELVRLSAATYPAVTLTVPDVPTDAFYIRADGGDVTVFCSQR